MELAVACCFQVPHASGRESGRDEPLRLQVIGSVTAERVDKLCLLCSFTSGEAERNHAMKVMRTGFSPLPSIPRPPSGSIVSQWSADLGFPRYVTVGYGDWVLLFGK